LLPVRLLPDLLGAIAVGLHILIMRLVLLFKPQLCGLLTSKEERSIKMEAAEASDEGKEKLFFSRG